MPKLRAYTSLPSKYKKCKKSQNSRIIRFTIISSFKMNRNWDFCLSRDEQIYLNKLIEI